MVAMGNINADTVNHMTVIGHPPKEFFIFLLHTHADTDEAPWLAMYRSILHEGPVVPKAMHDVEVAFLRQFTGNPLVNDRSHVRGNPRGLKFATQKLNGYVRVIPATQF